MMRRLAILLLFCVSASLVWAGKTITVSQLDEMLRAMHRDNKSDTEVSSALKQVELSEELTRSKMNSLVQYVPGPLSTEQIYVLEARSAALAPPASDIPAIPAPDEAAQQALLAKAATYTTSYAQLPSLRALRTTLRFQDNLEALAQSTGQAGSAKEITVGSGSMGPDHFLRYIRSTDKEIGFEHGVQRLPADKTQWGANGMIALMDPDPDLAQVFRDAKDAGTIKWQRWEIVNGKRAAVFSFQVPKKAAHIAVNVCCFPKIDQAGIADFSNASGIDSRPGGNFQTNTDWHPYKQSSLPYHGEFFIDPDTGIVVRMITQMEPKSSDVVHQDDIRTDYGPVTVGGRTLVLPVRAIAITEVVVNGEAGAGGYSTRHTLFTSEYKNYQPAGK